MLKAESAIFILATSLVSVLLIHALLARLLRCHSGQIVALFSVVVGFFPMLLVASCFVQRANGEAVAWMYLLLAYSSLGYTYFHFYNTSETARRIRLLHELDRGDGLTAEEISRLYRTEEIIELRLRRLVHLGQLDCVNGVYKIKSNVLYAAACIMEKWQVLLGLRQRN